MDKETRDFLDRKFNAVDEKFAGIDQKFDETKRYFGVVAEGLRSEIQQVAEGVVNLDEKLDRELTALRQEMRTEFSEVKSMVKFSYTELDRRMMAIESEVTSLKSRMDRLEARQN